MRVVGFTFYFGFGVLGALGRLGFRGFRFRALGFWGLSGLGFWRFTVRGLRDCRDVAVSDYGFFSRLGLRDSKA